MNDSPAKPGVWLLLILFSIGSVIPGGLGLWLLCVGCDDVAFTISQTNTVWRDAAEYCCETENSPDRDQQPERLASDDQFGACDCVRVTVDSHDAEILPTSSTELDHSFALMAESMSDSIWLTLYICEAGPRGPPDIGWSPATQTLFGQRIALVI